MSLFRHNLHGMVVEEEEPWLEVILAEGEVVMEGVEVAVMVVYAQEEAAAVPGKVLEDSFVPDWLCGREGEAGLLFVRFLYLCRPKWLISLLKVLGGSGSTSKKLHSWRNPPLRPGLRSSLPLSMLLADIAI